MRNNRTLIIAGKSNLLLIPYMTFVVLDANARDCGTIGSPFQGCCKNLLNTQGGALGWIGAAPLALERLRNAQGKACGTPAKAGLALTMGSWFERAKGLHQGSPGQRPGYSMPKYISPEGAI
jgi:hypothetical protein